MRMKIQLLFLSISLLIIDSVSSQTLPYTKLFDDTKVSSIYIYLDPDSLEDIYDNLENEYEHTALFIFDDGVSYDTVENIGFRLRGNTSLSSEKKSFKVSFNTYVQGRKYEGVEKLNLLGMHNDPTMVREKLYFDTYNAMGMPQRRSNFVRVYLNDDYYGLYTNMEQIDEVFLKNRFGHNSGNLFKCTYPAELDYRGSNASAYIDQGYELETNKEENNWDDLIELVNVINNSSDADFVCALEEVFNVQQYLWIYALDISSGHWDSYTGNINNYYLYHNIFTDKFEFLSFDTDNTFGVDWLGFDWTEQDIYNWPTGWYDVPLATRVLEVTEYRNQFSTYLKIIKDTYLQQDSVAEKVFAWRDLIAEAAAEDEYRTYDWGYTFDDFWDGFNTNDIDGHTPYGITNFVESRNAFTENQLEEYTMPPVVWKISHDPLVPGRFQTFTINVNVVDDGEIEYVLAHFYANGNIFEDNFIELFDDGLYGDAIANDGIFGQEYPFTTGVSFFDVLIEVQDADGNTGVYPPCDYYRINIDPSVPSITINEVLAKNNSVITDNAGEYEDYIELYNWGELPQDITGFFLTDDPENPNKWQFPSTIINPDSYLLIWADDEVDQGAYHTNFKLSKSEEFIGLYSPATNWFAVVDSFSFSEQAADISYGRIPNGLGNLEVLPFPSPGYNNEQDDAPPPVNNPEYPYLTNNPSNINSSLFFQSDGNTRYTIFLTDIAGRNVATLYDGLPDSGIAELQITTSNLTKGVYFVHLKSEKEITTLALIKI